MTKFMQSFIKAQSEIHNARLDSNNPHFKSKYASLEAVLDAVKPTLNKYGMAVTQPLVEENGKLFVLTKVIHESGEFIESKTPVMFEKQTAQSMGSGISYARRYSLAALVCIGADDDDGNEATANYHRPDKKPDMPNVGNKVVNSAVNLKSAGEYKLKFGKSKGKALSEMGAIEVSNMMKFVKEKADQKFRDSEMAKEFMFWAEQYLKNNLDPLDAALNSKPESMDEPPDWND